MPFSILQQELRKTLPQALLRDTLAENTKTDLNIITLFDSLFLFWFQYCSTQHMRAEAIRGFLAIEHVPAIFVRKAVIHPVEIYSSVTPHCSSGRLIASSLLTYFCMSACIPLRSDVPPQAKVIHSLHSLMSNYFKINFFICWYLGSDPFWRSNPSSTHFSRWVARHEEAHLNSISPILPVSCSRACWYHSLSSFCVSICTLQDMRKLAKAYFLMFTDCPNSQVGARMCIDLSIDIPDKRVAHTSNVLAAMCKTNSNCDRNFHCRPRII